MNLEAILQTVLASTASAAIVAFLAQRLVKHWLDKDVEQFRIELTAKAEQETEKLRAQLQQVATEHQVRYTRLHEKRTFVIATVYARVEKLHAVVRNWHENIGFWQIITAHEDADTAKASDQEKHAEAVEYERRAREAAAKLEAFYYPRAIWLEPDLCVLINKLIERLTILFHMLDAEARGRPFHTKDGDPRAMAARVLERATQVRTTIEARFRAILGIGDAVSTATVASLTAPEPHTDNG